MRLSHLPCACAREIESLYFSSFNNRVCAKCGKVSFCFCHKVNCVFKTCFFLCKSRCGMILLSVHNFFACLLLHVTVVRLVRHKCRCGKFCPSFPQGNCSYCQLSLTNLIRSSISIAKDCEAMTFFSTVSIEEMMVVWLRLRILPMPGKDISVISLIR